MKYETNIFEGQFLYCEENLTLNVSRFCHKRWVSASSFQIFSSSDSGFYCNLSTGFLSRKICDRVARLRKRKNNEHFIQLILKIR